ncbi:hypothetical protein Drorol1_Dr00002581 [Drosera rotundifolia]
MVREDGESLVLVLEENNEGEERMMNEREWSSCCFSSPSPYSSFSSSSSSSSSRVNLCPPLASAPSAAAAAAASVIAQLSLPHRCSSSSSLTVARNPSIESDIQGSRLGITTVISTDSIRHMMRSFAEEEQNPLLWASTYHAGECLDPVAIAGAKAKRKAKKLAGITTSLSKEAISDALSGGKSEAKLSKIS